MSEPLNQVEEGIVSGLKAHTALTLATIALSKIRSGGLSAEEARKIAEDILHRITRVTTNG